MKFSAMFSNTKPILKPATRLFHFNSSFPPSTHRFRLPTTFPRSPVISTLPYPSFPRRWKSNQINQDKITAFAVMMGTHNSVRFFYNLNACRCKPSINLLYLHAFYFWHLFCNHTFSQNKYYTFSSLNMVWRHI